MSLELDEVLFFGDSITWGMSHSYTGRYEESYPQMLEHRLAARGLYMVESALCSRTTNQDDEKFDWLVGGEAHFFNGASHFMGEFLAHRARVLVLLLGTNDLKPHIRSQVRGATVKTYADHVAASCGRIALHARRAHDALGRGARLEVVIVSPPAVKLCQHSIELGFDDQSVKISHDFPRAFQAMCKEHGFHFVHAEGVDMDKSVDGVHVTLEDTRKIAEAVWNQALHRLLPRNGEPVREMQERLAAESKPGGANEPDSEEVKRTTLSWIQCAECHKWRMNEFGQSPPRQRWTCRNSFWQHRCKEWKTGCGWNEDEHIALSNPHPDAVNVVVEAPVAVPPVAPAAVATAAAAAAASAATTAAALQYEALTAAATMTTTATGSTSKRGAEEPRVSNSTTAAPKQRAVSQAQKAKAQQQQQPTPSHQVSRQMAAAAAAAAQAKRMQMQPQPHPQQLPRSAQQQQQPIWPAMERNAFRLFMERLSMLCEPSSVAEWSVDAKTILNERALPMSQFHAFQKLKQAFLQYPQVLHDLDELVMGHPHIGVAQMYSMITASPVAPPPMFWPQQPGPSSRAPPQQQHQQPAHAYSNFIFAPQSAPPMSSGGGASYHPGFVPQSFNPSQYYQPPPGAAGPPPASAFVNTSSYANGGNAAPPQSNQAFSNLANPRTSYGGGGGAVAAGGGSARANTQPPGLNPNSGYGSSAPYGYPQYGQQQFQVYAAPPTAATAVPFPNAYVQQQQQQVNPSYYSQQQPPPSSQYGEGAAGANRRF